MHVEIQVALNFLISFLYNKLPRRRVNQFGEELENALKAKFEGHWYPEKPCKGSAYRCIRCTPPLDPLVFEVAARNSGINLLDIQENLPQELSIWVDPGEVSYRISEKGSVKILFSEKSEVKKSTVDNVSGLNPEAQCFKPIESINTQPQIERLSAVPNGITANPYPANQLNSYLVNKKNNPVTFTTAAFAATKFGSTKLKSNSKKSSRGSPTDFTNNSYIKPKSTFQQKENYYNRNKNYPFSQDSLANGMNGFNKVNNGTFNDSFDAWNPNTASAAVNNCATNVWTALQMESNNPVKARMPSNYDSPNKEVANIATKNECSNDYSLHSLLFNDRNFNSFLESSLIDDTPSTLISEKLWDEILNFNSEDDIILEPNSVSQNVNIPNNNHGSGGGNSVKNENSLYFASFPVSSVSSPSWSSSNESSSLNLINEFDNLSINSTSSSSVGSVSSWNLTMVDQVFSECI